MGYVDTTSVAINPRARRRRLLRKRFLRRPLAIVGLVVAITFIVAAILAPVIAPYSASTTDFNSPSSARASVPLSTAGNR